MNANKIKKIIYSILKELLEGESIPSAVDYDVSEQQFYEILSLMKNEGYINPKKLIFNISGGFFLDKSLDTVTMKGINFLEENNNWSKIYKGIKEFRSFLPK